MKILYVPARILNKFYHSKYSHLIKFIEFINIDWLTKKLISGKFPINAEYMYVGDIPKLLGYENFYVLGGIHPIYYEEDINKYKTIASIENYPSNFNFQKPKIIQIKEAILSKDKFDVIIYSVIAHHEKYFKFIKTFKNKIPIFLIDRIDQPRIYIDHKNISKKFNKDFFDYIFKADLPISYDDQDVFPLSPLPIRKIKDFEKKEKIYDFSFIGKFGGRERKDRDELIEFIKENFSNSKIIDTTEKKNRISYEEMSNILCQTKINISPSGVVWDSYRHMELVNNGSPILIPKNKECKVIEPEFKDMENCITYDTQLLEGEWRLTNKKELLNKLTKCLNNDELLDKIYFNYKNFVEKYHLRINKSKYVCDIIKQKTKLS